MNCRVCDSVEIESVMSIPPIPLVGEFTREPNLEPELFPITVSQCQKCKVLQIQESVDSGRLFREYSFSSSTVPGLVRHFTDYAQWIWNHYKPQTLLEVGCNDGVLLSPLSKLGVEVYGLDISENIGELARSKGLSVRSSKFCLEEKDRILEWTGRVDFISASNTFPHNDDPNGFLKTAYSLLKDDGRLALEVMYAGSLQSSLQWDTIYHEHLHFHSLESLRNLLKVHGFTIEYAEIVPMHAGSLRIVASRHDSATEGVSVKKLLKNEESTNLNLLSSWKKFADLCWSSIEITHERLESISENERVWAYGASGRATMWLKVARLDFVEKVIDASPLRANHFMPGSQVPIIKPSALDQDIEDLTIFVTAWNYLDGIKSQHTNFKGRWVIPLPEYKEYR
jgi:methylation protein EvaC